MTFPTHNLRSPLSVSILLASMILPAFPAAGQSRLPGAQNVPGSSKPAVAPEDSTSAPGDDPGRLLPGVMLPSDETLRRIVVPPQVYLLLNGLGSSTWSEREEATRSLATLGVSDHVLLAAMLDGHLRSVALVPTWH